MTDTNLLTLEELAGRFPQFKNNYDAMHAVTPYVLRELSGKYPNLSIEALDYRSGYNIIQELEIPTQEKGLFGRVKRKTRYETRTLVHLDSKECELQVKVNERPVIEACEKVSKAISKEVSVKLSL